MSAEIESLSSEMHARRAGRGASPMLVAIAVVALLAAGYAHLRFGQVTDKIDRLRTQVGELKGTQDRLGTQVATLAARIDSSQAAIRNDLRGLRELPAQVGELGQSVEELRTRTEAPQRAWVRAEAMYLLELGERRLKLENDVRTAIVAMEAADARLATLDDPAVTGVRRLLAEEIAALRAVPIPDLSDVLARIDSVEAAIPQLPVLGVPVTRGQRPATANPSDGPVERGLDRLRVALRDLVSFRRIDPATSRLVTQEEESLRRQHLDLLLFSARVAAMEPDGPAYRQALQAAADWLGQYFDTSDPRTAEVQAELAALSATSIAPPLPPVGGAARQLHRVMRGNAATP